MKVGFYKTNGEITVQVSHDTRFVYFMSDINNEQDVIIANKKDILFLKKCIDEILEDENYE